MVIKHLSLCSQAKRVTAIVIETKCKEEQLKLQRVALPSKPFQMWTNVNTKFKIYPIFNYYKNKYYRINLWIYPQCFRFFIFPRVPFQRNFTGFCLTLKIFFIFPNCMNKSSIQNCLLNIRDAICFFTLRTYIGNRIMQMLRLCILTFYVSYINRRCLHLFCICRAPCEDFVCVQENTGTRINSDANQWLNGETTGT